MNKQSIQKLSLFLIGLEQRISENSEFFIRITALFKSGTKDYTAEVKLDNGKLRLKFGGNTETLEISWLSARLSKHSESYDSLSLTYEERGAVIYIDADNKNVKMKSGEAEQQELGSAHPETSRVGGRDYYVKAGSADRLLKEIGIMAENGKFKNDMIRKYNQIDHFVELIDPMLRELTDKHDSITVLDCGCGKSYLLFVLNYYIKEVLKKNCHFIGLDYSNKVIEASKTIAHRLRYNNMEFKTTDIKSYIAEREIHLVVSLHACDTATDEAIALAVNNSVSTMVVVPCCHRELLNQYSYQPLEQVLKHGILKARIADALTDGMRALFLESLGYKVSITEYISPVETPKNLMIRAEKLYPPNKKALEEYRKLKSILRVSPALEKLVYISS